MSDAIVSPRDDLCSTIVGSYPPILISLWQWYWRMRQEFLLQCRGTVCIMPHIDRSGHWNAAAFQQAPMLGIQFRMTTHLL